MRSEIFLNIHHLLAAAWRRRYAIALPVLIVPVFAVITGMITPKKYQNHTTLLVQETSRMNPFLEDFSVSTQLKERMAALKALLHSRHVLSAVTLELYSEDDKKVLSEHLINQLSSRLNVQLIGSDMVKITYQDSETALMKRTLEIVTKHFLDKLLAPEKSSISASEIFLKTQLAQQHKDLLIAEKKLSGFKSKYMARLPDQYPRVWDFFFNILNRVL